MTHEQKILSYLDQYGVGVYKPINSVLKEIFPFVNDDTEHYDFNIHQGEVKDLLNIIEEHGFIKIRNKYGFFGNRMHGKNYTLDDVEIIAAITPQGSDRINPKPQLSGHTYNLKGAKVGNFNTGNISGNLNQEVRSADLPAENPQTQPNKVPKKITPMTIMVFVWEILSKNPLISAIIALIIGTIILKWRHIL